MHFVAPNDAVKSQTILNNSERQKVTALVGPSEEAKTEKKAMTERVNCDWRSVRGILGLQSQST